VLTTTPSSFTRFMVQVRASRLVVEPDLEQSQSRRPLALEDASSSTEIAR
jgi:hypothetical protein